MDHMDIWNKVKQPPPDALKEIKGGRMSGKTDISPQWRMQAMTEVFGPCGIGWKWTIEKLWTEPGPAGEVMAFALVNVWTRAKDDLYASDPDAWSSPIPGIGGNALVAKESGGLRGNDEAYKMAVTDALSVAFKSLGVAADIYAGKWDGSKYKDGGNGSAGQLEPPKRLSERERPPAPLVMTGEEESPLISDSERRKLFALLNEHGVSSDDFKAFISEKFQITSRAEIRRLMLPALGTWIRAHKKAVA